MKTTPKHVLALLFFPERFLDDHLKRNDELSGKKTRPFPLDARLQHGQFIARLREETDKPLVLGFGISTPEQAQSMNGLVNGFIVGSALVRRGAESAEAVRELAAQLRGALD